MIRLIRVFAGYVQDELGGGEALNEEVLKLLVGVVDAQLLKRIGFEDLKEGRRESQYEQEGVTVEHST